MSPTVPVRPAASVLIVDDRPDLHVVLGRRRPGSIFVGGLVVFPGGGVDPEDADPPARRAVPAASVPGMADDDAAAFLHAAIRETREEVGLDLLPDAPADPARFPHVGHYLTPVGPPRRYDTHFFLAHHAGGVPVPDREELVEAWWERPGDALRRIDAGEIDAILPTLELLAALSEYRNVADAFAATGKGIRRHSANGWAGF